MLWNKVNKVTKNCTYFHYADHHKKTVIIDFLPIGLLLLVMCWIVM